MFTVNGKAKLFTVERAPLVKVRPEPVRSLNDSPLIMRLVVEAEVKEE